MGHRRYSEPTTIVVGNDDPDYLDLARRALEAAGYHVAAPDPVSTPRRIARAAHLHQLSA